MQIPQWKRWLSYLSGITLERVSSKYNPFLQVSLNRGRLQLSTANAVYSYADLYDNFVKAFAHVNLNKLPGDEVLLLGFGLGSIPVILEQKFNREYYYTAIEVDEAVLGLATKYVLPDLESPIQMICADAYAFVMQTEQQYDLICMDIFSDDKIPEPFESEEFLEQLATLVSPGGLLLFNRLAAGPYDIRLTKHFFEHRFLKAFPNGGYLDVGGNWMLFNDKQWLSKESGE